MNAVPEHFVEISVDGLKTLRLYDSLGLSKALGITRDSVRSALNPRKGLAHPSWFVPPVMRAMGTPLWTGEAVDQMIERGAYARPSRRKAVAE